MIRLKGQSSWRHAVALDGANAKMQFLIAFDQVNPKGKFHGVSKIVLDMPRDDATFMQERLAFSVLPLLGQPAPCASSATLTINGALYGLYTNEEHVSHAFLKRIYPADADGDLFKGGVTPQTNTLNPDVARLKMFWNAHDIASMSAVVDMNEAISEWSAEMLLNDADGYYGGSHNFYLYDYPGKGYQWLVHDADASFNWIGRSDANPIYWWNVRATQQKPGQHYLIVMNDPTWRANYIAEIRAMLPRFDVAKIQGWIDAWSTQIAADVAADPHKVVSIGDHNAAIAAMRKEVSDRAAFVGKFLGCQDGSGDLTDADGDGTSWCNDCNDKNAGVHPGAAEICGNGLDDNCNGAVDEGCRADAGTPCPPPRHRRPAHRAPRTPATRRRPRATRAMPARRPPAWTPEPGEPTSGHRRRRLTAAHVIRPGQHYPAGMSWQLDRGATVAPDGTVTFSLWAPRAEALTVRLLAPGGTEVRAELPMARADNGVFSARAPADVAPVGSDYVYLLPGVGPRPDPVSRRQPAGVHGPSRIVASGDFRWSDDGWSGVPLAELIFYELHVGTFSPEGTFAGVAAKLPYLRDLGVTAIELMPVVTFPGERNWGYDGASLFAPHEAYGGPAGLRQLVDACHAHGLALFLDVVYNHLGPEGNYLQDFGPYFTDRYKTPWGAALNFDGPDSDEVRRFFVDNALHWLTDYHVDGLRLDAIHGIFDFGARHILAELSDAFHAEAARLGRRAWLVGESDLNDPRVIQPTAAGGLGLDAQWSDDFHHAQHVLATGNRRGYFVDFGGAAHLAKAISEGFVYDGQPSAYRRRRHGAPAAGAPGERFVAFNQNHDQIANACQGRRLAQLVGLERQKVAATVLFSTPALPLLFHGEEYAEDAPFDYFTSHGDPALAEAVRQGRHQEYLHLLEEGTDVGIWADPQADADVPAREAALGIDRPAATR